MFINIYEAEKNLFQLTFFNNKKIEVKYFRSLAKARASARKLMFLGVI